MEKIHAEEFFMEQMRRNLKRVVWILAVLILALVVRLFWIQILGSEDLKQAVCDQSLISLQGANTRGLIYDRNGLPMVADHKRYLYIIRKKDMDFQAAKLLASADAEETGSRGKAALSGGNQEVSEGGRHSVGGRKGTGAAGS